ncbi:MAG: hypothetical protein ACJ72N_00730 [Labedaea sp.]
MAYPRWSPSPPRFVWRRAVQGVKPDGGTATTIFDLREDRAHVAVYPATVGTYALLIDGAGMRMLLSTAESRDACAVPGIHAVYGERLLGLCPYDPPHAESAWIDRPADAPLYQDPMELYVRLPRGEIHIIYRRDRMLALREVVAEVVSLMR